MESHVKIYDEKMNGIDENFHIDNVSKSDSAFIFGITDNIKKGLQHDLPSLEFRNPSIQIDIIKFENPIINDISAFKILKNKSNHPNDFLITFNEFKTYYRIYCFNTNRETHNDNSNRYMDIISNIDTENTASTIYKVWRNYATITINYSKNSLVVY